MTFRVQLALYDLSRGMLKSMSMALMGKQFDGIWHTGVLVYGKEWYFGGGIQCMQHEEFVQMHGGSRPQQYIDMGETEVPETVFRDFIAEISPRFTQATYNLFKHNCNNFSNEICQFLLSRRIPQYILDLPEEVLRTPMGQMLLPMVEQMSAELSVGVPFTNPNTPMASNVSVSSPTIVPTLPTSQRDSEGHIYPLLDKHTKPLLSVDSSAVSGLITRLIAMTTPELSETDVTHLLKLRKVLTSEHKESIPLGAYEMLQKIMQKFPETEFKILCLYRLMALHPSASQEQQDALFPIFKSLASIKAPQVMAMTLCTAANMFATPAGSAIMQSSDILDQVLDATLMQLGHSRTEVRQFAAALIFNYALCISQNTEGNLSMPEELTQILLGCLEGLLDETDDLTMQRRLMAAGCVMRKYQSHCTELVEGCDLGRHVIQCARTSPESGNSKHLAVEIVRLLRL